MPPQFNIVVDMMTDGLDANVDPECVENRFQRCERSQYISRQRENPKLPFGNLNSSLM